jgi:aspartyl-tRNA(Asn)/glutamyl-tRNA(Gln) amidotransferase subunit C
MVESTDCLEDEVSIDRETVAHVARLAQLALSPEELDRFASDLSSIVSHIDRLAELNTDDVEPTAHAFPVSNVVRDDSVLPSWSVEQVLANAPHRAGDFFEVQAILD